MVGIFKSMGKHLWSRRDGNSNYPFKLWIPFVTLNSKGSLQGLKCSNSGIYNITSN